MDLKILGEGSFQINDVMKEMKKNRPSFSLLIQNYATFGYNLNVDEAKMVNLERKLNLGTMELEEFPRELLKVWKAAKGSAATLLLLHEALVECGNLDIADALRTKFCPEVELDRLMKFQVANRMLTLEELIGRNLSKATFKRVFEFLRNATQPIELLRKEVIAPERPAYYIHRTVLQRTELDKKIFSSDLTKDHVFLLRGITKYDLATATGYPAIDTSGDQLDKVTVRFILLEHDDDFDTIKKISKFPVHLIDHDHDTQSYFWVKSSKGLYTLQKFLKSEGTELSEHDFVGRIAAMAPPCAFCISDSPGMGKTLLLGSLARQIMIINSSSFSIFIVLQELVKEFFADVKSKSHSIEIIAKYLSDNNEGIQLVFKQMLCNDMHQFDMYFDGYDEVPRDLLKKVDEFLKFIRKLENVRVYVTTRPHLKSRIENHLKLLSFEILPLDRPSQVKFLTKYWCQQDKSLMSKEALQSLETFATACLEKLEKNLTEDEREIAGIPLQCMMLAEVCMKDAKRYASLKIRSKPSIRIVSFFDTYKKLVEAKFNKIQDPCKIYRLAHVYEALQLLFPDWTERFDHILTDINEIDLHKLFAIRILEKSSPSKSRRFVHRTLAEYILAEYLVQNMTTSKFCLEHTQ